MRTSTPPQSDAKVNYFWRRLMLLALESGSREEAGALQKNGTIDPEDQRTMQIITCKLVQ